MKDYSSEIAAKISSYLDNKNIRYHFDLENGVFSMEMCIEGQIRKIDCKIRVREHSYSVFGICPISADVKNKTVMAELCDFLTHTNYRLVMGNFDFDSRDGEIRYKVYVPCEDMELSEKVIEKSFLCPLSMFKKFGTEILEICFKDRLSEETIKKSECESITEGIPEDVGKMIFARLLADAEAKSGETPDIKELLPEITDAEPDLSEA